MVLDVAVAITSVLVVLSIVRGRRREDGTSLGLVTSDAVVTGHPALCRVVRVYFVKPSRYDDLGRVQHFWRGVLPTNTLTVLAALNEAYNRRHAGGGVHLETVLWDEQVDGPVVPATVRAIGEKAAEDGVEVLIGLAGVQTNQYPRGRDLADDASAAAAPAAVKEKYRRVCRNWHRHGVAVHCGYMIGFPYDGPDSGREAATWLREVGVDLASFFIVTPLPGDHDRAVRDGTIADWDFNQYDSQHMVSHHPRMTIAEVVDAYREAYLTFYSVGHLLRSALTYHRVPGLSWSARGSMLRQHLYYFYSYRAGHHPMVGGLWQRPVSRDAVRQVRTDEEARAHYLGGGIVSAEGVRLALPA